ncbi:transmembrane protein, putative (macronuclear) [Tetrahymena thermophila SB210]|uniref:Transmembrane protein, putative n=1 Tax=Tetrahymena thermophila (strain SB210) TaxID=312017 RepID=W7XA31_TETTS|nr:transmembrane protein, putative [Tetrahymena thermophila SB210]EWS76255.1 transmembrane protein, putative [Tetrahymena thermophila SB210]|eukprot:XP_012651214.1 transmembrane protein, putative [Tetrahymena thermophila SB210]
MIQVNFQVYILCIFFIQQVYAFYCFFYDLIHLLIEIQYPKKKTIKIKVRQTIIKVIHREEKKRKKKLYSQKSVQLAIYYNYISNIKFSSFFLLLSLSSSLILIISIKKKHKGTTSLLIKSKSINLTAQKREERQLITKKNTTFFLCTKQIKQRNKQNKVSKQASFKEQRYLKQKTETKIQFNNRNLCLVSNINKRVEKNQKQAKKVLQLV